MDNEEREKYLQQIQDLKSEVLDREKDLAHFRNELSTANQKLTGLIAQINHELKLANHIHKILVPTEFPNIPAFEFSNKYLPSTFSGGDYFDIFEHEDRFRFGLIIASSSGPFMSALLISVLLKLTGQMEARKGAEPHKVMHNIVNELVPNIEENGQADLFYGLIDRRSFELSYCRVGNIIALKQNYSSNELISLKKTSGPLNRNFNSKLESETISLSSRDRLIFCTPGVVESKNLEGDFFGQDRLLKTILNAPRQGVHELRNYIFYQLQKFSSGQESLKDLTVVVSEVKDRVIKLAKNKG